MSKFSGTFSPLLQPYNLHLASSLPFKSLTNDYATTTAARDSSKHTHYASLVIENHPIQFSRIIVSTNEFTKKSPHAASGVASVVHRNSHRTVAVNAYLASICQDWKGSLQI